MEVIEALEASSLAGVAEPDVGLLTETGLEMPFAACAYENVAAILQTVYDSADVLSGEKRRWWALKNPRWDR